MKTARLLPSSTKLLAAALLLAGDCAAISILVYNNNNSGPGSLRQAINDNNALGGGNTIAFSNIVTGTITLTSGELVISTNVTILGPDPQVLTVSGNNATRVFNIAGGTVAISGLTIANGRAGESEDGGGILSAGTLRLTNCVFVANRATDEGNGGGLFSEGNVIVDRCAFIGNSVEFRGGGMSVSGSALLNHCTIVSNLAGFDSGGGVFSPGGLIVDGCTIVANYGGEDGGGGISGSADVRNTIVAGNSAALSAYPDVSGTFTSGGYNFIGAADGGAGFGAVGDQLGTTNSPINPNLSPLGFNGGTTPTVVPYNGSPVIDQGKSFGWTTDQRGRARTYDHPSIINATLGDGTDIGAVEVGVAATLVVSNSNDSGSGSLRQTIFEASPFESDTITFAANVTNPIVLTSGELVLDKHVSIYGPTALALTVSGNNSSRVLRVVSGNPQASHLTFANGFTNNGGGILLDGGLELSYCQVVSNTTSADGGGIYVRSNAVLTLNYCGVAHNQTFRAGGGIGLTASASAYIFTTTIASNRTTASFFNLPHGAGIAVDNGTLVAINCTVAGNSSSWTGGGVSTFAQGMAEFRNTIIAGNTSVSSGPDGNGAFISGGFNLIGNTNALIGFTNTTDRLSVDPLLGPLATYGGRTLSMALRSGSPAIDAGNSFGWLADQRPITRPLDDPSVPTAAGSDGSDIGAYEADPRFRIVHLALAGNDVGLGVMTMLGRNYRVEYASNVDALIWPVFTNAAPGNGHLLWVTNFGGANQPRRFYRAGNSLD